MADFLATIGDPELRATLLYVSSLDAPTTSQSVASGMGVHPNVARSRLDRLTGAGLLTVSHERRTGRTGPGAGRPSKVYELAPHVRQVEFPARNTPALVAALSEHVEDGALSVAGRAFAADVLPDVEDPPHASLGEAAAAVCRDLSAAGFHAHLRDARPGSVVIETPACPLRPFVRREARLALADRAMWEALLEARCPSDVELRCVTEECGEDGVCRVVVEMRPRSEETAHDLSDRGARRA